MDLSVLCSVVATLIQIYGYYLYNRGAHSGEITPSAASWLLWGVGSFITAWSYAILADDLVKNLLPLVCAIVAFLTFVLIFVRKGFGKPSTFDVIVCIVDFGVIGFWLATRSAEYTNVVAQADATLSFVPIIRSTWKNPSSENAKPWFVWCVAYTLLGITVLLRYEKWWDLMYPVVYFILHAIVGLIARFKTAKV